MGRSEFPILLPNFRSITLEQLYLIPHFVILESLTSNASSADWLPKHLISIIFPFTWSTFNEQVEIRNG